MPHMIAWCNTPRVLTQETLQQFQAKFGHVFFCPGNHEMWLRNEEVTSKHLATDHATTTKPLKGPIRDEEHGVPHEQLGIVGACVYFVGSATHLFCDLYTYCCRCKGEDQENAVKYSIAEQICGHWKDNPKGALTKILTCKVYIAEVRLAAMKGKIGSIFSKLHRPS
eukprot:3578858-Amphidinium_carterae.1